MASSKKKKKSGGTRSPVAQQRSVPWVMVGAVTIVLLLAAGVFGYVYIQYVDRQDILAFTPSQENPDPSKDIPGVEIVQYEAQMHVAPDQRVAYDKTPPFGGPHDGIWADCTGQVYDTPVRNENLVHSLEHGAVWIAYNPDKIQGADREALAQRVEGEPYTMMSPYPGMDSPISLQSWGHRLQVDNADDQRIDQFITALRQNNNGVYPEIGGACQAYPGAFDPANPPPLETSPPPPDAVTMDGRGAQTPPAGGMGG